MYDAPDAVDRQAEKVGHVIGVPQDFFQKCLSVLRQGVGFITY